MTTAAALTLTTTTLAALAYLHRHPRKPTPPQVSPARAEGTCGWYAGAAAGRVS